MGLVRRRRALVRRGLVRSRRAGAGLRLRASLAEPGKRRQGIRSFPQRRRRRDLEEGRRRCAVRDDAGRRAEGAARHLPRRGRQRAAPVARRRRELVAVRGGAARQDAVSGRRGGPRLLPDDGLGRPALPPCGVGSCVAGGADGAPGDVPSRKGKRNRRAGRAADEAALLHKPHHRRSEEPGPHPHDGLVPDLADL